MAPELPPVPRLSISEAKTLGEILFQSGYFPDVRSAAQGVVKILAGLEMGFGPFASVADVHIIEGHPSIGAHLRAAAIKRSGKYDFRVVTADKTACELEFFERGRSVGRLRVTMEEMTTQGIAVTKDGHTLKTNWQRAPDDMLFARAISKGYRRYCPDLTGGVLSYDPDELDGEALAFSSAPLPSPPEPGPAATGVTPPAPVVSTRTTGELKDAIDNLILELKLPLASVVQRCSELYATSDLTALNRGDLLDLESKLLARKAEGAAAAAASKSGTPGPGPGG
jgi:hypothetical protein